MKFCDHLTEQVKPIWEKTHNHPFVTGLGDGSLDKNKFRFYMIQDYLYLIDFSKLFALGAVKADDVETMSWFANLLDSTLNVEMDLHRKYASQFNISAQELEQAKPSPITLAYNHYMLSVSHTGSLAELVSALLPCMWSYWEIGKELNKINGAAEHEFYGEWIKMYSSNEFGSLALWLIELLNQLTENASDEEKATLEEIFLTTSRFEYMFWDMAFNEQMWPSNL